MNLLELLVSTVLSAIIILIGVSTLKHSLLSASTLRDSERSLLQDALILSIFKNSVWENNALNFTNGPRLHAGGSGLPGSLAVNPTSDAISVLAPSVKHLAVATKRGALPEMCAAESLSGFNSFLAITVNGTFTIRATPRPASIVPKCNGKTYQLESITPLSSPFNSGQFPGAGRILAVIPLTDAYSLYIDTNQTLRRVSTLTQEHQPVYFGISKMSLRREGDQLLAIITYSDDRTFSFSLSTPLAGPRDYLYAVL